MPNVRAPDSLHFHRALFVRLDRIGDLVLTLPTDQSVSIDDVDWWIPKGLSFITDNAFPPRKSIELAKQQSFANIFKLAQAVRIKRYDFVVVFQAPWWVSLVVWLARIPTRVGVQSQWHSFLFLNRAVRQKRSRAEMSELEYGFRLLEEGLDVPQNTLPRRHLELRSKTSPQSLAKAGLKSRQYIVVHPGMSGSALNWPAEKYVALVREFLRRNQPRGIQIAITGTVSDEAFLAPVRAALRADPNVIWLDGKLSGDELIGVLENAFAVVAPSTGVLHLAASTGVPTVGLFSQVHVQRALRWGPQGSKTAVVEAPVDTNFEAGMSLITVAQVIAAIDGLTS